MAIPLAEAAVRFEMSGQVSGVFSLLTLYRIATSFPPALPQPPHSTISTHPSKSQPALMGHWSNLGRDDRLS